MTQLFFRNLRLLVLLLALIFVWGASAFYSLPRLEDPELTSRAALVKTHFPGASAERVDALVTEKIEAHLREITEIETYESTSNPGLSVVVVELQDQVQRSQVDNIWTQVRDKLRDAQAEFPPGIAEPELEAWEARAYSFLVALTWDHPDPPNYAILSRRAKILEDQLQALPGTEKVMRFGVPEEEIAVEVESADLVALGLSLPEVARQIEQSDVKGSAGQLRGQNNLVLEVKGELDSLERIQSIPLRCATCGPQNNSQFVRLGDIAQITKGTLEPLSEVALISDRPAVVLGVFVESNYRLDQWSRRAHRFLQEFRQELPQGLQLQILLDQSTYVTDRLNTLIFNLVFGAVLLFGVIIVMMGWKAAVAVQSALPITVLIVFGCMGVAGIPLHQMSVTGLIVSLGILIDNAIIVVDEVQSRLHQGVPPRQAAIQTVLYLRVPLLASTLTTVIAFLPIALLPGAIGEFVGTIGLNVILAVSASLVVALTLTPVIAAKLLRSPRTRRHGQTPPPHPGQHPGLSLPQVTQVYRHTLDWTYAHPGKGVLLSLILPILGFALVTTVPLQFFPAADRDQMPIEVELPVASSLAQTQAFVREVRSQILQYPEVQDVHWFLGRSTPKFYYNQVIGRDGEPHHAGAIIQLRNNASLNLVQTLQTDLDQAFPSSRILVRPFEQGPPFDAPIELRLYGSDLETLRQLGEQARQILAQTPRVIHTRARLNEVLPQLALAVDEEMALAQGLNPSAIAQQLETALEGVRGGSILEGSEELPVRVRLNSRDRTNLAHIRTLDLLSGDPQTAPGFAGTPLSSFGDITLEPKFPTISRRNGERVNLVQGYLTAGTLPSLALADYQQRLETLALPGGYRMEFGGEVEERDSAIGSLLGGVGILAILILATLVLSLGSFRLAALIFSVAIAAIGLGFLAIWLFRSPLGFNPLIGTVGLIGVAVNDSITVLSALKEHPVARQGDRKAVRDVVLHATRHVLTTTFTTMIGFVPLILGGGGFWPPLAIPVAAGVGGATILALYFIPSAFLLLMGRKNNAIAPQVPGRKKLYAISNLVKRP